MMHQQILTLFLVMILVGLSVWIGFEIVAFSASATNRDAVTNHLLSLGGHAKAYYRTPRTHGGGENSFRGLTMAKLTMNEQNMDGQYSLRTYNKRDDLVEIVGIGTEPGVDGTPVEVKVTVFADDSVSVQRIN